MEYPELHASTNNQLRELLLQFNIGNEDIIGTGANGRVTKMDRIKAVLQLYKHTKSDFQNWQVQISKGNIEILNHNNQLLASKRVNTSSLKPNYHFNIYIVNGSVSLWIESHINMPFYTPIDDFVDDSLSFYNTPVPHQTFGRTPGHSGRKVEPHRTTFL